MASMAESTDENDVRTAIHDLLAAYNAGDATSLETMMSQRTGAILIGTAAGERLTGEQLIAAVRDMPDGPGDVRAEQGEETVYVLGDVAWTEGTSKFVRADGAECAVRVTRVLAREDGRWKFVHIHDSIGAADEKMFDSH
jgi:ketosteroid isomerase-like protein